MFGTPRSTAGSVASILPNLMYATSQLHLGNRNIIGYTDVLCKLIYETVNSTKLTTN